MFKDCISASTMVNIDISYHDIDATLYPVQIKVDVEPNDDEPIATISNPSNENGILYYVLDVVHISLFDIDDIMDYRTVVEVVPDDMGIIASDPSIHPNTLDSSMVSIYFYSVFKNAN